MSSQWFMAICRTNMVFGKFKNIQTDCTVVQLAQNIRTREEQKSNYSAESTAWKKVTTLVFRITAWRGRPITDGALAFLSLFVLAHFVQF